MLDDLSMRWSTQGEARFPFQNGGTATAGGQVTSRDYDQGFCSIASFAPRLGADGFSRDVGTP